MALASVVSEEQIGQVHGNKSSVSFGRIEFLEIVHIERPSIIYRGDDRHFFFLAGLAVCTSDCTDSDFKSEAILLPWLWDAAQ